MYALTVVAVRLFGLWIAIQFSMSITGVLLALHEPGLSGDSLLDSSRADPVFLYAYSCVPLVVALLLIGWSKTIAAVLMPRRTKEQRKVDISITDRGLMRVGTALLGFWFVVVALRALVTSIALQLASGLDLRPTVRWASSILELILGVGLILVSRQVLKFLTWTPGPTTESEPDAEA